MAVGGGRAMAIGGGRATRSVIHGERFHGVLEVGNFGAKMLELRGELGRLNSTYGRSGRGNFHYFVSKFTRLTVSGVEANTVLTLLGRRCKNSSRMKVTSTVEALSPSSCCRWRRNCEGLRSPKSSELNSC